MTFLMWLRKAPPAAPVPATTPQEISTVCRFLELPGELRNQIYRHAIYPQLETIIIINGKPEHLGATVLNLSLFRVSQQIRTEAMSFLFATKRIKLYDIDTANTFFESIGDAIRSIKALTLVQKAREITPACDMRINQFFSFLHKAEALREFDLLLPGEMSLHSGGRGEDWKFLRHAQRLGREWGFQVPPTKKDARWVASVE